MAPDTEPMEYNSKQLQIIGVAEKLFAEKGFSGTSVRDISQEADINVSMISYYFGSKEKLIEALFEVRSKDFLARLESLLLNADLSPIQKVNLMIDGVVERLIEKQCFHNIVVREQLAGNRTPIISDLLRTMKMKNLRAMEGIIEEGQQLGVFQKMLTFSCCQQHFLEPSIRPSAHSLFTARYIVWKKQRSRISTCT
jgi:AcrR family transcriptional regulator